MSDDISERQERNISTLAKWAVLDDTGDRALQVAQMLADIGRVREEGTQEQANEILRRVHAEKPLPDRILVITREVMGWPDVQD